MHKSKLVGIFKSLTYKEIERLDAIVHSPVHLKNEKLVALFDLLKSEYPQFDETKNSLEREQVSALLYPQNNKADTALRVTMSQLTKVIEDFIVNQSFLHIESNNYTQILLRSLRERGLMNIYKKELDEAAKQSTVSLEQSCPQFYHDYQLNLLNFDYNINLHNRDHDSGIQATLDSLEVFYISSKLTLICAALARQKVLDEKHEFYHIDNFLELIQLPHFQKIPYIKAYYNLYRLLREKENTEQYYANVCHILEEYRAYLPDITRRELYVALINYCTQMTKMGKTAYYHDIFDFYKILLNTNIIYSEQKTISPHHYKNIVTVALRLKEYDWAKNFIQKCTNLLPPDFKDTAYNYSSGALYFELGEYAAALDCLMKTEAIDSFYGLNSRVLLCKTYYELNELNTLGYNLESFRVFLVREKTLSKTNNLAYKNFTYYLKRLTKLKENKQTSPEKLQHEIAQSDQPLIQKAWLLEKITALNTTNPRRKSS
jgi:tetratricopeptide (TPR) repeat protein